VFRVRYWPLRAMRKLFEEKIGPTQLMAEGFGGLGLLAEDRAAVTRKTKLLIDASQLLKKLSAWLRPLIRLADSVYVVATKR
jgi:hypothetical protein